MIDPSTHATDLDAIDTRRLRHGAGPSLPDAYNAALDGLEIGPDGGSCGSAAYQDRTVSVYDIETDNLVGTFANYYRAVRDPSPVDMELTARITRAAAAAIESARPR